MMMNWKEGGWKQVQEKALNTLFSVIGLTADIRNRHLANTSQKRHHWYHTSTLEVL